MTVPPICACNANGARPSKAMSMRMANSLVVGFRTGLQVRDDGFDLRRLEVIAKAGHARRAVGDERLQRFFIPLQRDARERRAVLGARHLRLWLGPAAGFRVESP